MGRNKMQNNRPPERQHNKPSRSTGRHHGKPQTQPPDSTSISQPTAQLPLELQQQILNIFASAFPLATPAGSHDLSATIQDVKGHLYNRDFAKAFSTQCHLEAYALRWSAARALAYADIFAALDVWGEIQAECAADALHDAAQGALGSHVVVDANLTETKRDSSPTPAVENASSTLIEGKSMRTEAVDDFTSTEPPSSSSSPSYASAAPKPHAWKVVSFGGGAGAEIVALAAANRFLSLPPIAIEAIDIADWSLPLQKLNHTLSTPPTLSAYAPDAVKAANRPFLAPGRLHVNFTQQDILSCTEDELRSLVSNARLTTLMFTLNELFTASISRTTAFLLALTDAVDVGSWLLVLDSPGSYSEVKLGKEVEVKKYPMQWLLDHTLLKVAGEGKWRKDMGEESKWFRVPPMNKDSGGLRYVVELENTRFQMHLFQKIDGGR